LPLSLQDITVNVRLAVGHGTGKAVAMIQPSSFHCCKVVSLCWPLTIMPQTAVAAMHR